MKKLFYRSLLIIGLSLTMISCDLLPFNLSKPKPLDAKEAKVELRSANQTISGNMEDMLKAPGFSELYYLMVVMNGNEKSSIVLSDFYSQNITYSKVLNLFRGKHGLKSMNLNQEEGMYGIFEYDFSMGTFDIVEESSSVLQFSYPADEVAMSNNKNNAVLKIWDLKFDVIQSYTEEYNYQTGKYEEVETEEEVPISAQATLTVDGSKEMSAEYTAAYSSNGLPTKMEMELKSGDYSFKISFSGSSTKYKVKGSHKMGSELLMGYEADVEYTSDMETVKTIDGYYQITPLKFEGKINSNEIETYLIDCVENEIDPDLDYLNSQISVEVIQTEENALIGHLEFFMYTDDEYGYEEPMLAIVYEDGTYDWMEDVMTFAEI